MTSFSALPSLADPAAPAAPPTPVGAMILAAGRGERMRPLTDHTPKPLLHVRGKPLMQWPMEALARQGFTRFVVNTAWLGEQISDYFGTLRNRDGRSLLSISDTGTSPLSITYSHEGLDFDGALETAGGIVRALPLLGTHFWVLAGDVFAPDFRFEPEAVQQFIAGGKLAHLWLVPNPAHNPKGDFGLSAEGLALNHAPHMFTFSTVGLYHSALFATPYCDIPWGNPAGQRAALAPLLRKAIDRGLVSAALYTGEWTDVGTPERLASLAEAA